MDEVVLVGSAFAALIALLVRRYVPRKRPVLRKVARSVASTSVTVGRGFELTGALPGAPLALVNEASATGRGDALSYGPMDGPRRLIASDEQGQGTLARWLPGGRAVVWSCGGLERVDLDTGVRTSLGVLSEGESIARLLCVDRNSSRIAYVVQSSGGHPTGELRIHDLASGNVHAVVVAPIRGDVRTGDVSFERGTAVLAVTRPTHGPVEIWEVALDGSDRRHVFNAMEAAAAERIAISRDGSRALLASDTGRHHARWFAIGTDQQWRLSTWVGAPAWSPDGRTMAGLGNGPALWLFDVGTGEGTKVVELTGVIDRGSGRARRDVRAPVWSEDGRFVAFWLVGTDDGVLVGVVDVRARRVWVTGDPIHEVTWAVV